MINQTRIMLYVESPVEMSAFWQNYFQASVLNRQALPDDFEAIILDLHAGIELALFPEAFVRQYSPEVLGSTPSIMFFSDQFEQLQTTLPNAGEVVDNQGTLTFNFADPEGHYFVVAKA